MNTSLSITFQYCLLLTPWSTLWSYWYKIGDKIQMVVKMTKYQSQKSTDSGLTMLSLQQECWTSSISSFLDYRNSFSKLLISLHSWTLTQVYFKKTKDLEQVTVLSDTVLYILDIFQIPSLPSCCFLKLKCLQMSLIYNFMASFYYTVSTN